MVTASYKYHFQSKQWIGIITENNQILTIGCEETQHAIVKWLMLAKIHKPWISLDYTHCPDMHDRENDKTLSRH